MILLLQLQSLEWVYLDTVCELDIFFGSFLPFDMFCDVRSDLHQLVLCAEYQDAELTIMYVAIGCCGNERERWASYCRSGISRKRS